MKLTAVMILIVALLGGCKQTKQQAGGKIVVRSPYADHQTNITATITTAQSVVGYRDLMQTGQEIGKPYPSLAPNLQIRGVRSRQYETSV